jgi:hypothetical protein
MRDLNDLDPLPALKPNSCAWHLPVTNRHRDEARKDRAKRSGEDWQPYKRDGQIVPHTYINGQGKLKTEGYQPPEPPETDIPIPCVVEMAVGVLARIRSDAKSVHPSWCGSVGVIKEISANGKARAMWQVPKIQMPLACWALLEDLEPAEPQTQTASQMEPENLNVGWKDGWIPHKPGDPMPCAKHQMIRWRSRSGEECPEGAAWPASEGVAWADFGDCIIAWKPAT